VNCYATGHNNFDERFHSPVMVESVPVVCLVASPQPTHLTNAWSVRRCFEIKQLLDPTGMSLVIVGYSTKQEV